MKKIISILISVALIITQFITTAYAGSTFSFEYSIINSTDETRIFYIISTAQSQNNKFLGMSIREVNIESQGQLDISENIVCEESVEAVQLQAFVTDGKRILLEPYAFGDTYNASTSIDCSEVSKTYSERTVDIEKITAAPIDNSVDIFTKINGEAGHCLVMLYDAKGKEVYCDSFYTESGESIVKYVLCTDGISDGTYTLSIDGYTCSIPVYSEAYINRAIEELSLQPDAEGMHTILSKYKHLFLYADIVDMASAADMLFKSGVFQSGEGNVDTVNMVMAVCLLNEGNKDTDINEIYETLGVYNGKIQVYKDYLDDALKDKVDSKMYCRGFLSVDDCVETFYDESIFVALNGLPYYLIDELLVQYRDYLNVPEEYFSLSEFEKEAVLEHISEREINSISEIKNIIHNGIAEEKNPSIGGVSGGGGGGGGGSGLDLPEDECFTLEGTAIVAYNGNYTEIEIPQVISGVQVTAICADAFSQTAVTKVYIPYGITDIAQNAFSASEELVIMGELDSAAEKYAEENGYAFSRFMDGEGTKSSPYIIYSGDDLRYAVKYLDEKNVYFRIGTNLFLSGFQAEEIKGIWDADGYSIVNNTTFINKLTGTFKHLIYDIGDTVINGESAAVFCNTNNGLIEFCTVKGNVYTTAKGDKESDTYETAKAAIIALKGNGTIKSSGAVGSCEAHGTYYANGCAAGISLSADMQIDGCWADVAISASDSGSDGYSETYAIGRSQSYKNCFYNYETFGETVKRDKYAFSTEEMKSSEFVGVLNKFSSSSCGVWKYVQGDYPISVKCFDSVITASESDRVVTYGEKITLSSETEGTIYYTTDGSDPDVNSLKYIDAIAVMQSSQIKAVAFDGQKYSRVYTFNYILPRGSGTEEAPYLIANETELALLRLEPEAHFRLESNIDILQEWEPVDVFSGVLDGAGYGISNVSLKYTDDMRGSAFIVSNKGTIKALTIKGDIFSYSDYYQNRGENTAGIVASNGGLIEKCFFIGNICAMGSYSRCAGGICANNSGRVTDSGASGSIFCKEADYVGGVAGYDLGEIYNCHADISIRTDAGNGTVYAGGLIGYRNSDKELKYCYATGNVYAETDYWYVCVGGLIGENYKGAVTSCWSDCTVGGYAYRLDVGNHMIGGFIGNNGRSYSGNGGNLTHCYSKTGSFSPYNNTNVLITECGSENFDKFDYFTEWSIDEGTNGGYPYINLRGIKDIRIEPETITAMQYSDWSDLPVTVTAVNDENEESVITKYSVEQFNTSLLGESDFSISYKGFTKQFAINVITDIEYAPESDFTVKNGAITGYTGDGGNVVIPKKINFVTITKIEDNAFLNAKSITSVTIPETVISIGENAFKGTGLVSVNIPASVKSIGDGAFSYTTELEKITVDEANAVFRAGNGMLFYDNVVHSYANKSGKDVVIPDKTVGISAFAFAGCANIESVSIPDSVTEIFKEAFADCTSLKNINIPSGITLAGAGILRGCTSIGEAFYDGSTDDYYSIFGYENPEIKFWYTPETWELNLTENGMLTEAFFGFDYIRLPDSVKAISGYAMEHLLFHGQTLKLYIPKSVIHIDDFYSYDSGTECVIYYEGSVADWCRISNDTYEVPVCDENGMPIMDEYGNYIYEFNEKHESWVSLEKLTFEGCKVIFCEQLPTVKSETLPESPHPYPSNAVRTWVYTASENAKSINLTFSEQTYTWSCDYIYIFDGELNEIGYFEFGELAGKTVNIPGRHAIIRLSSGENYYDDYGFKVEACEELDSIEPKEIILSENYISMVKGTEAVLSAMVKPENADYTKLVWTVADSNIAEVTQEGVITAVGTGRTVVTVEIEGTDIAAQCYVNVHIPAKKILLDTTEATVRVGEKLALSASVEPSDTTDKIVWRSLNTNFLTISSTGVVTARKRGRTIVRATAGNVYADCVITVINPCSAPVFSIPSGIVEKGTTVELSCPIEGAKIYYTTDSTPPTEESNLYNGAIVLNKTTTITAVAIADDMDISEAVSCRYTVNHNIDVMDYMVSFSVRIPSPELGGQVIASMYDKNDELICVKFYEPQELVNVSFSQKGEYIKVMWWDFLKLMPFCNVIRIDI